jgi:DNA-binding MarR family transcriptional regulator/ribosomal protein S18 acetylase RimI-like enzyme
MSTAVAEPDRVETIRRFNRFYTRQIGVLREGLLDSRFSLTQGRVLFEVSQHEGPTATEVGKELALDAGYLSRVVRDFEKDGLIERRPSEADGRQGHIWLTNAGREAVAELQERARDEVRSMLGQLGEHDQRRLLGAMETIERLLGGRAADATSRVPYILRPPQPGDIGWIVHRQGLLYVEEYHWDETYEALAATIVGEFVQNFDPKRERCWVAERDGEIVGSVFAVKAASDDEMTAKLRLLYVEPSARGLGIGARLVDECIRFVRRVGYKKLTLWTQANLYAARRIYERAGFRLMNAVPNHAFGHDLISETWDLEL